MIKAVLGLGNPGDRYKHTRHNVGFEVLDRLARRHGQRFKRGWRIQGRSCKMPSTLGTVLLVKPQTFMNQSGDCAKAVCGVYKLQPEEMLVVVDDVDLPLGRVRIRPDGGSSGHNGLRSVEERLGSRSYPRLRLGVGKRPPGEDLVEFVLGRFSENESEEVHQMIERASDAVMVAVEQDVEKAMNEFNVRKKLEQTEHKKSEVER